MPQAAIAAITAAGAGGFAAGGTWAVANISWGAVAFTAGTTLLATQYSTAQARKQANKPVEHKSVVRESVKARRTIYGERVVGGQLVWAESTKEDGNHYLYMVIKLADHEVQNIGLGYFGERAQAELDEYYSPAIIAFTTTGGESEEAPVNVGVTLNGIEFSGDDVNQLTGHINSHPAFSATASGYTITVNHVTYSAIVATNMYRNGFGVAGSSSGGGGVYSITRFNGDQTAAWTELVDNSAGEWDSTAVGYDVAYVGIKLQRHANAWPQGIPQNITFPVQGKAIYDPRTTSTVYSSNAALVIRDYLYSKGFTDFDDASFIVAANRCDESETITVDGASQTVDDIYQIHAVIDDDEDPITVLTNMLASCHGILFFSQGKRKIKVGAPDVSVMSLNEDDLHGGYGIQGKPSRKDVYNSLSAVFPNSDNRYEEDESPEITSAFYQSQDGGAIAQTLQLPYTTDEIRSQILCNFALNQHRQPTTVSATFKPKALVLEPGDVIQFSLTDTGYVNKEFIVIDKTLNEDLSASLVLREYADAIYSQAQYITRDPAPNVYVNTPWFVQDVTGLSGRQGSIVSADFGEGKAVIFYDIPEDRNMIGGNIVIEYQAALGVWSPVLESRVGDGLTIIPEILRYDGNGDPLFEYIDIRAKYRNRFGALSDNWVTGSMNTKSLAFVDSHYEGEWLDSTTQTFTLDRADMGGDLAYFIIEGTNGYAQMYAHVTQPSPAPAYSLGIGVVPAGWTINNAAAPNQISITATGLPSDGQTLVISGQIGFNTSADTLLKRTDFRERNVIAGGAAPDGIPTITLVSEIIE